MTTEAIILPLVHVPTFPLQQFKMYDEHTHTHTKKKRATVQLSTEYIEVKSNTCNVIRVILDIHQAFSSQ